MVDIALPRTPTPSRTSLKHDGGVSAAMQSPAAPPGTITPPPSDRKAARSSFVSLVAPPLSPSPIKQYTHTSSGVKNGSQSNASGPAAMPTSPTPEQVANMSPQQLRALVMDLLPALGEARMELAHTRLQYQLLAITSHEAAERAVVEHDMTRKEVEVLQSASPVMQSRASITPDPRSPLALVQGQLEGALVALQRLEGEKEALGQRLKDAKRVIRFLDGKAFELGESNRLLRERICDKRAHWEEMRKAGLLRSAPASPRPHSATHSALNHGEHGQAAASKDNVSHYATPARPHRRTPHQQQQQQQQQPEILRTPATPTPSRTTLPPMVTPTTSRPRDDPFGALLFAGEVLDAQHKRGSLPSTPSPSRTMRQQQLLNTARHHHSRGALSLSELPVTPRTDRIVGELLHESEGTISESEDDETVLPGSQASKAASDLLKRFPGAAIEHDEEMRRGAGLVQTKLMGKVVKGARNKRAGDGEEMIDPKRQRLQDGVGLGIGMWPSPVR